MIVNVHFVNHRSLHAVSERISFEEKIEHLRLPDPDRAVDRRLIGVADELDREAASHGVVEQLQALVRLVIVDARCAKDGETP